MNRSSTLQATLRNLIPHRLLTYSEAMRLAELQANRLRELIGLDKAYFPEEVITEWPRIEVQRRFDLPVSGLTYWQRGGWVIGLNASEPLGRQRFSLAHEFKHVLDHTTKQWLYPASALMSPTDKAESLADYFAACLLMPKRHVKRLYGQGERIGELAESFQVTPRAAAVRLSQLGLSEPIRRCQPDFSPIRDGSIYFRALSLTKGVAA